MKKLSVIKEFSNIVDVVSGLTDIKEREMESKLNGIYLTLVRLKNGKWGVTTTLKPIEVGQSINEYSHTIWGSKKGALEEIERRREKRLRGEISIR